MSDHEQRDDSQDQAGARARATGPGVEEAVGEAAQPTGAGAGADADLAEDLARARQQSDELRDQLLRTQADYANFQRRMRAQAEAERPYAIAPLASDLLDVLDNFERAIDAARSAGADSIVTGLEMVHRQILDTLAKHGVEPIAALDQPFDPNFHEALMQTPSADRPEGTVVSELGRGYRIRDRVLRPSKVAVSVQP